MLWINATRNVTNMQNASVLGDFPNVQFVGYAMRQSGTKFAGSAHAPVSGMVNTSGPKPAPVRLVGVFKKSFMYGHEAILSLINKLVKTFAGV